MKECSFKPEINRRSTGDQLEISSSGRAPPQASKGGPAERQAAEAEAGAAAAEGGAPSHGPSHAARRSSQGSSVEAGERLYSHAQQKVTLHP